MKFGKKGTSRASFIKGFRDEETTLRFLEDYEDWTLYYEVFDEEKKQTFPSPGADSPEQGGRQASRKKLVNAVNVKTGYVDLYKVPATLFASFERRKDRNGTLLDRDYTIIKTGKGLNTVYEVEAGDPTPLDVSQYVDQMQDHEDALRKEFEAFWGYLPPEDDDVPRRPAPTADQQERQAAIERVRAKREAAAAETTEARREVHETEESVASRAEYDADGSKGVLPPSEPQQETSESAEEEEIVLTEDAVRAMSVEQLLRLYEQTGVAVPDEESREALADHLINALTE